MNEREGRGATSTISSFILERISVLLYTNWLSTFVNSVTPLEMKSKEEKERIRQETWATGLEANRVTALIRAGNTVAKYLPVPPEYYLPDPIYKIVIRRLKGLLTPEQLSHIHKL